MCLCVYDEEAKLQKPQPAAPAPDEVPLHTVCCSVMQCVAVCCSLLCVCVCNLRTHTISRLLKL